MHGRPTSTLPWNSLLESLGLVTIVLPNETRALNSFNHAFMGLACVLYYLELFHNNLLHHVAS